MLQDITDMKAKKYLKGGQVKLDANKDGKISGKDFSMLRKGIKKYQKGGKNNPTKKMKKADESEIDRRYGSTVGTNPRTGDLNYPNSSDMDKLDATAGTSGNPDKLRKAISDKYYSEQRKKMGIDKIKTYKSGGNVVKYQKGGKASAAASERESKLDDIRANSRQMSLERSVMAKVERGQKRSKALGRTYDTNSLSMEEKAIWNKIQKDGMTPEIKK